MNLQAIRTFVAVWRWRSISAAASQLGITQPAASTQIRSLEQYVGKKLFERHRRGVVPTFAGEELARSVHEDIDRLQTTLERSRLRSEEVSGIVRLATPAEFGGAHLPLMVPLLQKAGIDLSTHLGGREQIYDWLSSNMVDIAITASEPNRQNYDSRVIYTESLMVVAYRGHSLGNEPKPEWPWIAYDSSLPLIRSVLATNYSDVLSRINPKVVTPSLLVLRNILAGGFGVSVLPDYICKNSIERRLIETIDIKQIAIRNNIYLVWRRDSLRSLRTLKAKEIILSHFDKTDSS